VRPIETHNDVAYDLLLVATLEPCETIVDELIHVGVDRNRVVTLRLRHEPSPARKVVS
jgi:hypothetical protein